MSENERLRIVGRVTRRHGVIFAETWRRISRDIAAMTEGCDDAGIVEWPDSDEQRLTEPQERYLRIQEEIADRTWDAIRETIVTVFVEVATDVLRRERERDAAE
jgi:hypothetical protein